MSIPPLPRPEGRYKETRAEKLAEVARQTLNRGEGAWQPYEETWHTLATGVLELVADAEALAEALEAIKRNAFAWHGPPQPTNRAEKALRVIAKTADDALARYRGEK